jgi:hypothetical protein
VLDDIPVINWFFRYDSTIEDKSELLIIMTPHIIRNQADADALKRKEAAKMSWCINDITKIYGEAGLRKRCDEWTDNEVPVIYPDNGPLPVSSQPKAPEVIPAPNSQPTGPASPATQAPAAPMPMQAPTAPMPPRPQADGLRAPPLSEPAAGDPSASIGRYAPQPAQYGAQPAQYGVQQTQYAAQAQSPGAGVQFANYYQSQPGQQGYTAQPAVYQAPVGGGPAIYQQQTYDPTPPPYYPSAR